MVARRIDSESCVLTKFIVVLYGLVHLSARHAANRLTKCSPSRCRTPSVVTTKGVKSARRSQQASWCLFFFALTRVNCTELSPLRQLRFCKPSKENDATHCNLKNFRCVKMSVGGNHRVVGFVQMSVSVFFLFFSFFFEG